MTLVMILAICSVSHAQTIKTKKGTATEIEKTQVLKKTERAKLKNAELRSKQVATTVQTAERTGPAQSTRPELRPQATTRPVSTVRPVTTHPTRPVEEGTVTRPVPKVRPSTKPVTKKRVKASKAH